MAGIALLSVFDKRLIVWLAEELTRLGWHLIASSGTAKVLAERQIACRDLTDLVGPPVLNHKVVSLHPRVHGGLLADQSEAEELKQLGWQRIELLVCNLYPLGEELENPGRTPESLTAKTDIGGPTMLRAAAKGRRLILQNPSQYLDFVDWLSEGRPDEAELRLVMAQQAEQRAAQYAAMSAAGMEQFLPRCLSVHALRYYTTR